MGEEWYFNELNKPESDNIKDTHPLSQDLWSGDSEKYYRVINLGYFLFDLWKKDDSNNLSEKVAELKRYNSTLRSLL